MRLVFWRLVHRFRAYPNTLEVGLAIDCEGFRSHEDGEITVTIEAADIKAMTLAEIESLAVARATALLAEQAAGAQLGGQAGADDGGE